MFFNLPILRIIILRAIESMCFVINGWILISSNSEGFLLAEFIALMTIPNFISVVILGRITDKYDAIRILMTSDITLAFISVIFFTAWIYQEVSIENIILIYTFCLMSVVQVTNVTGRAIYRQYFEEDTVRKETFRYTSASFAGYIAENLVAGIAIRVFEDYSSAILSVILSIALIFISMSIKKSFPNRDRIKFNEEQTNFSLFELINKSPSYLIGFSTFIASLPLIYGLFQAVSYQRFESMDDVATLYLVFSAGVIVGSYYIRKLTISYKQSFAFIALLFLSLIFVSSDISKVQTYLAIFIVGLVFSSQNIFLINIQNCVPPSQTGRLVSTSIIIGSIIGILSSQLIDTSNNLMFAPVVFGIIMSLFITLSIIYEKQKSFQKRYNS